MSVTASGAPACKRASRACAIIPCFNVRRWCASIVRDSARHCEYVVAVDDGSVDGTGDALSAVAAADPEHIRVISFAENRGKGAALLAGLRFGRSVLDCDVLITMDGDGQHRPADIPAMRSACEGGADLVIGERTGFESMPIRSRIGNTVTSAIISCAFRGAPRDTQSGFRALSAPFAQEMLGTLDGRRYETEIRMLIAALRQRRRIAAVPIPTIYLDANRSSHFRPIRDSARILWVVFGAITGILFEH